jgi:hypothetical protein
MSKIIYPIPYDIIGLTLRGYTQRRFLISDETELEVQDVTSLETIKVAAGNFSWQTQNLPGQGGHNLDEVRHSINPAADIRLFNDRFYAPVLKFNTDRDENEPAKATDIGLAIGNFEFTVAHPFERMYHQPAGELGNIHNNHRYGNLKTLKQHKLNDSSERDALIERAKVIASAKDDLAAYIIIDGEAWRRLEHEPVISASTLGEKIDIMIEARIDIGAINTSYFRLSELEECLEFVSKMYPGKPVRQHFANLEVMTPEALIFDAEADAVERTAHAVERALAHAADSMRVPFQPAYELLRQYVWQQRRGDAETYAGVLQKLDETWNNEGLSSTAQERRRLLQLTLERWDMRPVRSVGMRL